MTEAVGAKQVSVCLLTYNHAHLVESTIRSILAQSLTDFEFIISDDCSTDATWAHVLALAATDSRIKPLRTAHNIGMAANANHAVAHSSGTYIALLHHDDIYRRDLLEKWSGLLDRFPGAAFVFNPYGVYESSLVYQEAMPGECFEGSWLLNRYLLPRWGCVVRGTAMIRRSAWDEMGGMRERFGLLSDVDLWMRLAMRWQVAYVAEPLIMLRQQRPQDYPETYQGHGWSWPRQRLLYEIHAANRLASPALATPVGQVKWWVFRCRLSLETAKWLVYAVVRKKPAMVSTCQEAATPYDLWPLVLLRWVLLRMQRR
jgi:glycosyltransferase involved in cell wall biosynthesis